MVNGPAFGEADLTNCERELIHLAGSVQPHGVLIVLEDLSLIVRQVSANCERLLGVTAEALLNRPLPASASHLLEQISGLHGTDIVTAPATISCDLRVRDWTTRFEGSVHRVPGTGLIIELEPVAVGPREAPVVAPSGDALRALLLEALQKISQAPTVSVLCDTAVQHLRELTGYDRVMVYKFDPDGHGQVISEARAQSLESLLGHHYPATDIPQRARELYLRNRLRTLVDVNYEPVPLVPRLSPATARDLDMSHCYLRSMSPLHLQYLKNMGVTATLVLSLVREGRLWGLVACHHYSSRNLRQSARAASGLLAEAIATRIAAIETYAHAQVAIMVRRLEQRLLEATSTLGDWRPALFGNPRTILQPLDATGAALFYDGDVTTAGDAPSTAELRALIDWIEHRQGNGPFETSSIGRDNPALERLTPLAAGVLAVRLSSTRPDYLLWFRKEQLCTITWAGEPEKQQALDNPLELSPRRSFAAWSEIVRGTAVAWTSSELALARAIGASLVDIIVQIHAVRLLFAEHQLTQVRAAISIAAEPVLVADRKGQILACSETFTTLMERPCASFGTLDNIAEMFVEPMSIRRVLQTLTSEHETWRGDAELHRPDGSVTPVNLRAEIVPGRDGEAVGFILIVTDLTDARRAMAARLQLEASLAEAGLEYLEQVADDDVSREPDAVFGALLANASIAAMDIMDARYGTEIAPLLTELEQSTRRAAALYRQARQFSAAD